MADRTVPTLNPGARARTIVAVGSLVPAVILAAILVAFTWIGALVVLVVVALASYRWLTRAGDRMAIAGLDLRPADTAADARLVNLVDGLCSGVGLRPPRLLVSADGSCNLLVAGTRADRTVLVVTQGLLDHLSRIELEGVLADGLVQIRHGDVEPATIAVATFGLASSYATGGFARSGAVDQAAAALTLYPPALARALETMEGRGTQVAGVRPPAAHLGLADPLSAGAGSGRPALGERAAALREM